MIYFRRYWRMALYAGAILASLSGTGVVMLLLFATYIMISRRQWTLIALACVAAVAVFLLRDIAIVQNLLGRATEYRTEWSSAFIRFVGPVTAIGDSLGNDFLAWLGGVGPGQAKELSFEGYVINPFVLSKLIIEYGIIGAIPFVVFITYCFFTRNFSQPLVAALYLMYMVLSGSLQQPHTVYLFLILCILFAPRREAIRREVRFVTP
jgi:hypothetical protein